MTGRLRASTHGSAGSGGGAPEHHPHEAHARRGYAHDARADQCVTCTILRCVCHPVMVLLLLCTMLVVSVTWNRGAGGGAGGDGSGSGGQGRVRGSAGQRLSIPIPSRSCGDCYHLPSDPTIYGHYGGTHCPCFADGAVPQLEVLVTQTSHR